MESASPAHERVDPRRDGCCDITSRRSHPVGLASPTAAPPASAKREAMTDRESPLCGMARKIHSESVPLLGWGRAILLQLAHPLVAAGVAENSTFTIESWGRLRRLHRTVHAMRQLTFGGPDTVTQVARQINAIHDRVHGHLRESAGVFRVGTPYSAKDPSLLRWVHATLLDSHLLAYERFVGSLTFEEQDRYCLESASAERLFAISDGFLPRSSAALRAYLDGMLSNGEIAVTGTARALAREIVSPPTFGVGRPLVWLMRLTTLGLLPPAVREAYGFPWGARDEWALRRATRVIRALVPRLPTLLRSWPAARPVHRCRTAERGRACRDTIPADTASSLSGTHD